MSTRQDIPRTQPSGAPLSGIRVIDLGQYIAGPGAAMVLAELGATVIKIEPPGGDQARHIGAYGESMVRAYNRGKRSIALDLKSAAGRAVALRLIEGSDVVIQNLRPGAADALGLGPAEVRKRFPRVIYLSVSGFVRGGPSAGRPGYDIAAQAESGLMSVTGEPDRLPQKVGVPIIDAAAAHLGAQAVLAALYGRERSGAGDTLETSLLEVAVHLQAATWCEYLGGGAEPARTGDGQPNNAPAAEVVPTRDGHIVLSAYAEAHWQRFCRVIGREGLATDPRFCTNAQRVRNRAALRAVLRESLSSRTSQECVELLSRNQIVVGAVRSYGQVLAGADLQASGMLVEAAAPAGQGYQALGLPYRLGDAPRACLPAAPACGADTDALLAEAGYREDDIRALRRMGVAGGQGERNGMPEPSAPQDARHERDAVIQTLPLFEMMRMRAATTARRHPVLGFASDDRASALRWVNRFTHTHRRIGPGDREVVSPNNDTVFSNAWLDLSAGPVVIESPDMGERYWVLGLLDAWTNPFAYVGRRTTGNRAQRTLVHGPGWNGALPQGITRTVAAPGLDVWVIGRILVDDDGPDTGRVRALQQLLRITRVDGRDAAVRVDTGMDGRDAGSPSAALYRRMVDAALRRNPPPVGEHLAWPVAPERLAALLPEVYGQLREKEQPRALGGGWAVPVVVRTHWGSEYAARARVARNFIGALGVEEAFYPTAEVDAEGLPLDGARAYELRFAPDEWPKVGAFWSLTVYRRSDCLLVANPIGRYSIGDRTPGLHVAADGSLAIRLQATDPGPSANWLPTPADGLFYVVLRLYQPRAEHLQYRFHYPPLRRIA